MAATYSNSGNTLEKRQFINGMDPNEKITLHKRFDQYNLGQIGSIFNNGLTNVFNGDERGGKVIINPDPHQEGKPEYAKQLEAKALKRKAGAERKAQILRKSAKKKML
jgi:hypothetical protein